MATMTWKRWAMIGAIPMLVACGSPDGDSLGNPTTSDPAPPVVTVGGDANAEGDGVPALQALDARVTLATGEISDLRADGGRPTVILFAQDSCSTCADEARAWKAHLASRPERLAAVNLYTVLVGAEPIDASDWNAIHEIPWRLGIDRELSLFQRFFALGRPVPAVIVFSPQAGIVLRDSREVTPDEVFGLIEQTRGGS